jgi:short-subunit dehydrogenase
MRLAGAVAVVTGASGGVGRATALALSRRGATVVGIARDDAALSSLDAVTGGTHIAIDVRDPCHAERVVAETVRRHDRIDAVVANAGVGHLGPFADMPVERIRELVDVNLTAPMLLARAALPRMIGQQHGAVVLVTSIAGAVLVPGECVYSVTKAALEAFAETLREETRGTGVTVSSLIPGAVDTDFFQHRGAPYGRSFPRPVPPDRVAEAIADLVTSGARRRVEPSWLAVAAFLHRLAPATYRALARRLA